MKQKLDSIEIIIHVFSIVKEILPSIATILVALISSKMVISSTNKSVKQKRADKLQNDLENFYYPFLLLSKKTTQLYRVFDNISKEEYDSCIVFLVTGKRFDGNALTIWKEIISNNKRLNNLIIKYSRIISNKELRDDLSRLSTHYTLLELANNNQLIGDEDVFRGHVFPKNIIKNIEDEIDKTLKTIDDLRK